jgi:hypothetical protein
MSRTVPARIDAPWRATRPAEAKAWLRGLTAPWWIAGGWAIDLHLGSSQRPHGDLDVGVFRSDVSAILAAMTGWEVFEARRGVLRVLDLQSRLDDGTNSLWCRPAGSGEWHLELVLDERVADAWVYRRDLRITKPLETFVQETAGLQYLSPDVQLLYKAKALRAKDQEDFERVRPRLRPDETRWLRNALELEHPGHPWIAALA